MFNTLSRGIDELEHQTSFSAIEVNLRKDKSQEWKCNGISQKQTDFQHDGPCRAVKKQHLRVWNRAGVYRRALDDIHLERWVCFHRWYSAVWQFQEERFVGMLINTLLFTDRLISFCANGL